MAKGESTRRDMGPEISKPPSSTGNAGGTKEAWDDNSDLGRASEPRENSGSYDED